MGINSAFTSEVAAGMATPPDEKADFLVDSSGGKRCYVHRSTSAPPRSSAWGRSHGFRDDVIVISPSEVRARAERRALVPETELPGALLRLTMPQHVRLRKSSVLARRFRVM